MKLLLSDASLKMAEQQARAQNSTVDDVVKNETLFTENLKTVEYRNQKVEGERATVEIKSAVDSWDTVSFVLEDGVWKIDKQAMANQMEQQQQMRNKELDDIINQGRVP